MKVRRVRTVRQVSRSIRTCSVKRGLENGEESDISKMIDLKVSSRSWTQRYTERRRKRDDVQGLMLNSQGVGPPKTRSYSCSKDFLSRSCCVARGFRFLICPPTMVSR